MTGLKPWIIAGGLTVWTALPLAAQEQPGIDVYRDNLGITLLDDAVLAERALERFVLGDLTVTSGAIVASDPIVNAEHPPFGRLIAPGRYPVHLYRLTGYDPRNALAEVKLAAEDPVRWVWATTAGQDPQTLEDGYMFGYGVDAGTGGFFDADAVDAIAERSRLEMAASQSGDAQDEYLDYYHSVLEEEMWPGDYPVPILHQPIDDNPVNMAIFSAGWGDGFYPTFWGLNADGEAVSLVTDFGVAINGDGRDPEEQYTLRMEAAMSADEKAASQQAYLAMQTNDLDRLRDLLASGQVTPTTWLFGIRETLQDHALSEDRADVMALLIEHGADGSPSAFRAEFYDSTSLIAEAEQLNRYSWREPLSDEMMVLVKSLPVDDRPQWLIDLLAR